MRPTVRCVYCSRLGLCIRRGPEGCQVECATCGHEWRSDDPDTSDSTALRMFAMRATLKG